MDNLNEEVRYKGVYKKKKMKRFVYFYAKHKHEGKEWTSGYYKTQRDAALAYDKRLISLGLEPINILRRIIK